MSVPIRLVAAAWDAVLRKILELLLDIRARAASAGPGGGRVAVLVGV